MERNFLKVAVESAGDNGWNRWEESTENADGVRLGQNEQKLSYFSLLEWGLGSRQKNWAKTSPHSWIVEESQL